MCLIVFGLHAHPRYPLVVAANRDEFVARPSEPAGFWPGYDGLLAGRDLAAGGAWMGVTRSGRFAALTNVRDPRAFDGSAPSRGELVVRFLAGTEEPIAHLGDLAASGERRNGFNLLAAANGRLAWYSNAGGEPLEVDAGVHAVSNALLDTPWPKVRRSAAGLARILGRGVALDPEELFAFLAEREPAPDGELPDTGVGLAAERLLSSPFIAAPDYGTRGSTLLLVTPAGRATFLERLFDGAFCVAGTTRFEVDFRGWDPPGRVSGPSHLRTGFKTPESDPPEG
ncbi:MAG TPA: NRDE family protein [Thermoanaerobaculia bacterium]|nr:NRDE family protein [Thermoanaerobaculia bacterium]